MTEPRDVREGTPAASERPCAREGDVVDFAGERVGTGPCVDRDGRPVTHTAYVYPHRRNHVLRRSVAGAVLLASALMILFFVGAPARPGGPRFALRTALSPGPTSSPHSMASTDCAQCHRPSHKVEDARCERCHDPSLSARLTNAAHVFQTSGDMGAAMAAPAVECATCHVEHRGADANLADVDDRECGTCHRSGSGMRTPLTTLDRHPEFAVVRAGVETGSGLKWFSHELHLTEVQRKFQRGCASCHEGTPDAASFQPISFPRHCATCHNEDLSQSAGSLTPAMIKALGAPRAGVSLRPDLDDPSQQVLVGLTHADPWILRGVQSLRRATDPASVAAERLVLDRQVAQLELDLRFSPAHAGGAAWLDPAYAARLNTSTPSAPSTSADNGLREMTTAVESLAPALGPEASAMAAEASRQAASLPAPLPGSAGVAGIESLRQLIEASLARARAAGDAALEARAKDLLTRVNGLSAGTRTASSADASFAGLEILINEIATVRDGSSREDVREMRELLELSRRKAAGGMDPTAFDQYRQGILLLLDAVRSALAAEAAGGANPRVTALLAREDSLRRLVLGSSSAVPTAAAAALGEFLRKRQADRTRIDLELEAMQLRGAAPRETAAVQPRTDQLAGLRGRLTALAGAPPLAAPLSPGDARLAIGALLGVVAADPVANSSSKNRCTLCHNLTPEGDQLAPVRSVGGSLLRSARFTHAPHLSAAADNCETCHTGIRKSTSPADVNVPPIASCRTCHAPGRQAERASGCESCHSYHASSARALRWRP